VISVVVKIAGTVTPPDQVVADVRIRSGRSRADDGLQASSATIEVVTPDPSGTSVGIADQLEVIVEGVPRFTGWIGEVTRAPASDPDDTSFTIVAVGPIARLPRLAVPVPRPAETAAQRIAAIFAVSGMPGVVIEGGAGIPLAAYGVAGDPPVAADEILGSVITDTGLVVADLGDGRILCQFLDSRISADHWTPDPTLTYSDLAWEQTDDLVNDALIEWPGGAAATATNPSSITTYGRHAVSLQTNLATLAAAQQRASNIVGRLAAPAWQIGAVESWDPTALEHGIGAVVTISPLGPSAPVTGGSWQGVLEGWEDQYGPDADGELAGTWKLAVSDRAHSAETVTWQNVSPAGLAWNQVNPGCSWQEATSNSDLYP